MPYADSDYERSWKMQTKGVTLYPATLERLYAAAPEMLAVVRMAIDYANDTKDRFGVNFDGDDAESYDKLMDAADAAIAKAEGRSE